MRTVVHWDGDSFFASIEQAADQRLRGRAVAVGGAQRGIVLSASREARRLGIRPGVSTTRARRLCPLLIVVPAHFDLYERFFDQILGLCRETTPLVEPASVGAAWLDLTGTRAALGAGAPQVMTRIRSTAYQWLRVSLSSGIATNKLVARIAARFRKPHAQINVPAGGERAFLAPLPLAWLPGLERDALSALEVAGLSTLGQFSRAPVEALATVLGRRALPLVRAAQGVDETPVGPRAVREPGFIETHDFAEDAWEEPLLLATLRKMLEKLMAQVRAARVEVRALTLRLRYTDRDETERTVTLAEPTAVEGPFDVRMEELLRGAWTRRVRLRSLTLRAGRIYRPSAQLELFAPQRPRYEQDCKLAAAIDGLRRVHGETIVRRAWELSSRERPA